MFARFNWKENEISEYRVVAPSTGNNSSPLSTCLIFSKKIKKKLELELSLFSPDLYFFFFYFEFYFGLFVIEDVCICILFFTIIFRHSLIYLRAIRNIEEERREKKIREREREGQFASCWRKQFQMLSTLFSIYTRQDGDPTREYSLSLSLSFYSSDENLKFCYKAI